jgi:hypothetical protein
MHGLALDARWSLRAQGLVGNQMHQRPERILEEEPHTEAAGRDVTVARSRLLSPRRPSQVVAEGV